MKKISLIALCLLTFNAIAITFPWRVNTSETSSKTFSAYHGETLEFQPEFISNGEVVSNLNLSIYWQTNAMANAWWSSPGTTFHPTNDVGASEYRFFIRADKGSGDIVYRANGRIRMLQSPGFTPSQIEMPVQIIDFNTIEVKNAPFALKDEIPDVSTKADKKDLETLATKEELSKIDADTTALGNTVAAWTSYWSGDDFQVTVTNYPTQLGSTTSPSGYRPLLSFAMKLSDGNHNTVWHQSWLEDWITNHYLPSNYYSKAEVDAPIKRAWGRFDSETGEESPEGVTQISSKTVIYSAGQKFQRYINTSGGGVWLLTGNVSVGDNNTSSNGLFRLSDVEGSTLIEAYKGDKKVVAAHPDAVTIENDITLKVKYNITAEPKLYVCDDLSTKLWKPQDDPECVANVTCDDYIEGTGYVVRVTPKNPQGSLFAYATYELGGESYIDIPYKVRRMKIGESIYELSTMKVNGETTLKLTPVQ